MPRRLPLLALTLAGLVGAGSARGQSQPDAILPPPKGMTPETPPQPPVEAQPLPPAVDLVPQPPPLSPDAVPQTAPLPTGLVPTIPPPDGPCTCLVPPLAKRPRLEPDYVQFLGGQTWTTSLGPTVPRFDYAPIIGRVGWYWTDPYAPGAVSFLFGTTSGVVTKGFGHYFTGPSIGFRYERRPDRDLVPYVQIGTGLAFNDAHKVKTQGAIGGVTEFCDQFEGGLRYRIAQNVSLDVGVAYQHISNAGFAGRNLGVNNLGFLAGFTYTFR